MTMTTDGATERMQRVWATTEIQYNAIATREILVSELLARHVEPARLSARRRATIEEALDHAQAIVGEQGAGAVTVSEVARRLGMRSPSLYKYFPSLHAMYDALFTRGHARIASHLDEATGGVEPGLDRLIAASRAMVRWSMSEPGLASLLYSRPVPGFEPSPEAYAPSQAQWQQWREDLAVAARRGQLSKSADSDEAMRLLTVVITGICSQQMSNEPRASFEDGVFTSLLDRALDMFVNQYSPSRPRKKQR